VMLWKLMIGEAISKVTSSDRRRQMRLPVRMEPEWPHEAPQIGVQLTLHGVVFDIFVLGPAGHRQRGAMPDLDWRSQQDSNLQPTE
jgi:hypothetical protein